MNWDLYARNMNKIIVAIKHGGDSGGAYFTCPSKLKEIMEKSLYEFGEEFSNEYKVDYVFIREFLAEIPQFVKKRDYLY